MPCWKKRSHCYNLTHESETGIELVCPDEEKGKKGYEKELKEKIQYGDVDEISGITPKDLTQCKSNALFMAMEMSFQLRQRAAEKGPDGEEFNKLAQSVDEFTCCLLNPLKCNTEDRRIFADSLDDVMEKAIKFEQKKLLAHPVLYSLMNDKWLSESRVSKASSSRDTNRWKWLLLNIWCLFDLVLFPILFPVLYFIHRVSDKTRGTKKREIVFVVNATSEVGEQAFRLMQDTMKFVMNKYSLEHAKFHVIIKGEEKISSESNFSVLKNNVERLQRGREDIPELHKDLEKAIFVFENMRESNSRKVLIVLTDHKTCARSEKQKVKEKVQEISGKPVKVLPIAIGRHVSLKELQKINSKSEVYMFGEYEDSEKVGTKIIHEMEGKDFHDRYLEYFMTPYFIFVRDTLSYLALLGLHVLICLAPSTVSLSGVEWGIFVFFLGRIAMKGKQFIRASALRGLTDDRDVTDNENGHKFHVFLCKLTTYFSDCWKILDTTTIVIYVTIFILRMVTWALSGHVTNNLALVIAGYLYGLNTMLLTLRTFGHVMETTKRIGAIQIALFHIIGDVATIFWQFVATMLAFSLAATKVYMAEKSYVKERSPGKELACSTSGINCWWSMLKHFLWSLLGLADLDPLDSVHSPSVILVYFLYAVFLIMAVILLVNMMIALLSNTYQQVADHSLMEWSFKKAITIQGYNACDPIPVPLNLISSCFTALWSLRKRTNVQRLKSLDAVVENLYRTYLATYGYAFPLTEETKLDHVLQETQRSRQMTNQITHRIFSGQGWQQSVLPFGGKAWQSMGISVAGCLLTCEGAETCPTCKDDPAECHGARYLTPFSPEHPHFEVLIQESGERRLLAVGVVWEDYGCHLMPGWQHGTVGYHVDDGKIFYAGQEKTGEEIEDAMAFRGDLIGCTVKFDLASEGEVSVSFTLNGKQITQEEIPIHNPDKRPLYPYICMANKGIRVLAKMNPGDDSKFGNIHMPDTIGQEGEEIVTSTLRGLGEMRDTFQESFTNLNKEIVDICRGLDAASQEFSLLEYRMCSRLNPSTNLKLSVVTNYLLMDGHTCSNGRHLASSLNLPNESRFGSEISSLDLLQILKEEVQWLGKVTNESLSSALKTLRSAKEKSERQNRALKALRMEVEKKDMELRDLAKTDAKTDDEQ